MRTFTMPPALTTPVLLLALGVLLVGAGPAPVPPADSPAAAPPAAGAAAPVGRKITHTYPQPPKVKADDPMRVEPGSQIPEHPERYTWKVAGKIRGKVVYPTAVPVYALDDYGGSRPTKLGEVPVGTEVKLDAVHAVGRVHYYAVPFTESTRTAWINGLYLEAAGYTPPDK